jgi:hypothetical protein
MELTSLKPSSERVSGVEIYFDDKASMVLAHAGPDNPEYQAELFRVTKKYTGRGRGSLSAKRQAEVQALIMSEVYANVIVKRWKGWEEKGVELQYSKEEVQRVFRSYPSVLEWAQINAMDLENYQESVLTEEEKENL